KFPVEPSKSFWCGTGSGHDTSIRRLAEFCLHTSHDRKKIISGCKMSEQKLAARSFCERELRGRVNCAEMIEILAARWQLQQMLSVGRGLNAKKIVKGQLSDGGFHTVLCPGCPKREPSSN